MSSTCDLGIDDNRLSRQHCALTFDGGILKIQDLNSTNGTFVNGLKLGNARQLAGVETVGICNTQNVARY